MGIPTAIRGAKAYMVQLYINDTVYQPRPAMRKNIWRSCVSTAISKANPSGNCHKQSVSISGASVYHKRDQKNQSENTSGRHSRVDQSGVYTAISKTKVYMAQLYINSPVDQPRSARRTHIWRNCASTSNRKPKRKPFWTTQPRRPERYINRDQPSESLYGSAVHEERGISTAISQAKHIWRSCVNSYFQVGIIWFGFLFRPHGTFFIVTPRSVWPFAVRLLCRCFSI